MIAAQPFAPVRLAGAAVEARRDAEIADDVQLVADGERRRRVRRGAPKRPRDVGPCRVACSVGAHRDYRRLLEAGGDVDEAVREDRPRHVGEAVGVADAPDLAARVGIVGDGAVRADADQLIAVADADDERRRVRLVGRRPAMGLPSFSAGPLVERDHECRVAAVAAEDQQVLVQRRRPAVAVLRFVREPLSPHDLAGGGERRGSVRAEVHVDPIAFDDRRRRGVGILRVEQVAAGEAEHLGVDDLTAGRRVEGERTQRGRVAVDDRRREPDPAVGDDRRRPADAGHRRLPAHVLRFTPFERQPGLGSTGPARSDRGTAASPRRRPPVRRSEATRSERAGSA